MIINGFGLSNVFKNQSNKPNTNNSVAMNHSSLRLSSPLSCDQVSFKGREPYTINDYRAKFAKDMKTATLSANKPTYSTISMLSPHYEGLMALVKGDPENAEFCNSFMKVAIKISDAQDKLKAVAAAKYTLSKAAETLDETPSSLLSKPLVDELSGKLSALETKLGASSQQLLHIGKWDETALIPKEAELPVERTFEEIMGIGQPQAKKAQAPKAPKPEIESFDDVEDVGRRNFDIIKSGTNPEIVSEAETKLIKEGRFDLIKEFMETVPLKQGASGDVLAKPTHGAVIFDLASRLGKLGKEMPLARKFVERLLVDKSIPSAVNNIIKGAVKVVA